MSEAGTKCLSEFTGTYLLVFTVGCNVLGGSAVWAATSIACVLMVSIYALRGVSGAHFNPAVTMTLQFAGKTSDWGVAGAYIGCQMLGGILAGLSYFALFKKSFNLEPGNGFGWWEACLVEVLYTFMLCFVVLNVAATKATEGNQYYGLAIGFVIVAGGYAGGGVSGGAFNPAVAFGIDVPSAGLGFGWSFAYLGYEFLGAALASALYRVVRPEEFADNAETTLGAKLISEFLGTFFLVLTVGLNVLGKSPAGAFSIGASLMCMIYALGAVSGAHFNPAVTLAIFLSGREKIPGASEMAAYMGTQIVAGVLAAFTYVAIFKGATFPLQPGAGYTHGEAAVAEIVFTFVLCFVVLSVATTKAGGGDIFGLAIGSCVWVGGNAIGAISGGSLNPAVSFGLDLGSAWINGAWNCLLYTCYEFVGAALAAGVFRAVRPKEYAKCVMKGYGSSA